jgi:hypothetical protein
VEKLQFGVGAFPPYDSGRVVEKGCPDISNGIVNPVGRLVECEDQTRAEQRTGLFTPIKVPAYKGLSNTLGKNPFPLVSMTSFHVYCDSTLCSPFWFSVSPSKWCSHWESGRGGR